MIKQITILAGALVIFLIIISAKLKVDDVRINSTTSLVDSCPTYKLGDFAQGGVVFWLDKTKQHGLVCAKEDQASEIPWSAGTPIRTMALGDGIYSGKSNTSIIVAVQGYGDMQPYAASICIELQITEDEVIYGDWYLPSRDEINIMYHNRKMIDSTCLNQGGGTFFKGAMELASSSYWTSTEVDIRKGNRVTTGDTDYGAWIHNFKRGNKTKQMASMKFIPHSVRAIRAF